MNNYEDWAQLVAKNLKGEGDLIAAIDKEELDDSAAAEAFVRIVLEPFLPESFGIGRGRVVDSAGNYSDYLDVIVYDRDYPGMGLRGTQSVYLYESVFAVFSIRAKLIRKSFFDALTSCASMADLQANVDKLTLAKMAKKNGLVRDSQNRFVHRDPLHTARFNLIGRPPAFLFGFVGMKQSHRQLHENIEMWLQQRRKCGAEAEMKSLPAVIATQGCFAWRNAAPLALNTRDMLGIGQDKAPIRLIILQLLYILNRRLSQPGDAQAMKPNLKSYLNQFSPPLFEEGAGNIADVISLKPATEAEQQAMEEQAAAQRLTPAQDRARAQMPAESQADEAEAAAEADQAEENRIAEEAKKAEEARIAEEAKKAEEARIAEEAKQAEEARIAEEAKKAEEARLAEEAREAEEANKAEAAKKVEALKKAAAAKKIAEMAAAKAAKAEADAAKAEAEAAASLADIKPRPIPKAATAAESKPEATPQPAPLRSGSPLGAAPIPGAGPEDTMPVPMLLDSEDVPDIEPASEPEPAPEKAESTSGVIPAKPPVDIELFDQSGNSETATKEAPQSETGSIPVLNPKNEVQDFAKTVIVPPPSDGPKEEDSPSNSTDAFIARVKEQLASSDPLDPDMDAYSSTIPH